MEKERAFFELLLQDTAVQDILRREKERSQEQEQRVKDSLKDDIKKTAATLTEESIQLLRTVVYKYVYGIRDWHIRPDRIPSTVMDCIESYEYALEVFQEVKLGYHIDNDFKKNLHVDSYLRALAWLRFAGVTEKDLGSM